MTKRAERMRRYFADRRPLTLADHPASASTQFHIWSACNDFRTRNSAPWMWSNDMSAIVGPWPLPNVWLGVSVEDQAVAEERIPLLLQTPAAVRFLSCEPLLGPVNLTRLGDVAMTLNAFTWEASHLLGMRARTAGVLDWVIVGGESGPRARPMHPDWARSLRDQCAAAGVPFFFKQWGEWAPDEAFTHLPRSDAAMHEWFDADGQIVVDHSWRYGKKRAGHLLDGVEHHEFPETRA